MVNLTRNNGFINRMRLYLLREKSGAILLVFVGFTTGRQSDLGLKIFKILYRSHC